MIKLKKIIKESKIELGKVYTDVDRPPFKSNNQIEEELLSEAQAEINTKTPAKTLAFPLLLN